MENDLETNYLFGEFELSPKKRRLLKQGENVALNSKAFDLLLFLVENHGRVVTKDELLGMVWEGQFVEENNLTVHIAALRKIFGDKKDDYRFIATIHRKGYKFVADVRSSAVEKNPANHPAPVSRKKIEKSFENNKKILGRTREISAICSLLRDAECRLITLSGAGGSGKTLLARAIAEQIAEDFADGVFFVELASISQPDVLTAAISNALGVMETGEKSLTEALTEQLENKNALLILDNFEQIISAAPIVEKLLAESAVLKILLTSRISLQSNSEREFAVMPLLFPPADNSFSSDALEKFPAVELFVRKARAVRENFYFNEENAAVISGICRRLDGLPLAIELAAARVQLLSPQAIFSRLTNSLNLLSGGAKSLPERQQTMRGTIQWSYDLLEENVKTLFRHLSVFAGGFSVEAAESVVLLNDAERLNKGKTLLNSVKPQIESGNGDNQSSSQSQSGVPAVQINILDLLTTLLDNNLLSLREQKNGEIRLEMLEVVREFAAEYLEICGETIALKQNHASYFLSLGENAESHLQSENSVAWLEKLETEHDNLRAALDWSMANDTETAGKIAAALRYFWLNHCHLTEGRRRLEDVLSKFEKNHLPIYFKLLHGLGQFARSQGDFDAARKIYEESFAATQKAGDREQMIIALHGLSALAARDGDISTARKLTEQQLAISRDLNDKLKTAFSLSSLGDLSLAANDPAAARTCIEESLAISRDIGDKHLESTNLLNLGAVAYREKICESAISHFSQSMSIAFQLGNKALISCCLDGFAAVLFEMGNLRQAAQMAGAADEMRDSIKYEIEITERLFRDAYVERLRNSLGEQTFEAAYVEGKNFDLGKAVSLIRHFFSNTDEEFSEIIIETHKFERFIIEEEIEVE